MKFYCFASAFINLINIILTIMKTLNFAEGFPSNENKILNKRFAYLNFV
jgi:hypothetical protein